MPLRIRVDATASKKLQKHLKDLPKKHEKALLLGMSEIMRHVVERSRLNAPILTGALRTSIAYERPRVTAKGIIKTAVGSDIPYALRWHEEPFNLGPISAKQPTTPEGGVGNKYIARAIKYRQRKYEKLLLSLVDEIVKRGEAKKINTRSAN